MATITITDITPFAIASGWAEPVSTALIDSPLFQHKLVKGDVVVSVLAHRNGVIADASRVNSVTGSFTLVGVDAPSAEFVLQWLREV